MARKVQKHSRGAIFPVENFTNFYFKPDLSPFSRALIFLELILCSFCVLGAVFLLILKLLG